MTSYIEEIDGELFDRPAIVLGNATRCSICHEFEEGHSRRTRKHAYTPEPGASLRVTFPANRRPGLPEEVTDYPFVPEGTTANTWRV